MKIQPIDPNGVVAYAPRTDPVKSVAKSRLKRLLERQFPSVLKNCSADKVGGSGEGKVKEREDIGELETSSLCLDTMVFGFIEEGAHEKPARSRCNCFNANFDESSDDEFDIRDGDSLGSAAVPVDAVEAIKGLVLCASVAERNLLADASKILEKAKNSKNKGDCRRTVMDGLQSLGYDAAICKSRWDKTPSFPAGEYEYIDVIADGGDRLLLDVDFRSEFEVARPTKSYRAFLQHLPHVFVGRPDRLQQIVAVASEAARQSLKKKGLHLPPWRRPEYTRAKWLSPYQRETAMEEEAKEESVSGGARSGSGNDKSIPYVISAVDFSRAAEQSSFGVATDDISLETGEENIKTVGSPWQPPPARPKTGVKIVAGLALVL